MSETQGLNPINFINIDYEKYKRICPQSKIVANVEQLKSELAKQKKIIEVMLAFVRKNQHYIVDLPEYAKDHSESLLSYFTKKAEEK